MSNKYPKPDMMPEMSVDEDGIIHTDYGQICFSGAHLYHAAAKYRELSGMERSLILHTGEVATGINTELKEVSESDFVTERVKAGAIVVESKVSRVLTEIYLKFQNNPYPTKMFKNKDDALVWLREFL